MSIIRASSSRENPEGGHDVLGVVAPALAVSVEALARENGNDSEALAGLVVVPTVSVCGQPESLLPAGMAFSQALAVAAGVVSIQTANLTAVNIGASAETFSVVQWLGHIYQDFRPDTLSRQRLLQFRAAGLAPGPIDAERVLEVDIPDSDALGWLGIVPLAVSPGAAMPAGTALSHVRVNEAGLLVVGVANLTAAPLDPGALAFNVALLERKAGAPPERWTRGRGAPLVVRTATLAVPTTSLPATLTTEIDIGGGGVADDDAFGACMTTLQAGLMLSHLRSAGGRLLLGVANVSAAPVNVAGAVAFTQFGRGVANLGTLVP